MVLVTPSCSPCIYSLRLTNSFTFPLQIIALLLEPGVPALLISSEPAILEDGRGNAWEKRRYLGRVTLGYLVSFLAWAFLIVAVCMLFRGLLTRGWLNIYVWKSHAKSGYYFLSIRDCFFSRQTMNPVMHRKWFTAVVCPADSSIDPVYLKLYLYVRQTHTRHFLGLNSAGQ